MAKRSITRSTSGEGNIIDMKTKKPVEVPSLPVICERIRYFREKAGLEQKAVARAIGVTPNAISNWENGRARPDINLIPDLCQVLDATLYELFDMEDPESRYSAQEKELIEKYRRLKPANRRLLETVVGEMTSLQEIEETPSLSRLMFYQQALAAGIGDPTEIDGRAIPIYLYEEQFRRSVGLHVSRRANCVFTVNGDSMEPDYYSGDLVLVERIPDAPVLSPGEIGAFIVGNETYIKKYSEEGLVSLNPRYSTMRFDNENRVYLIGRVLGKLDFSCVAAAEDIEKYRQLHGDIDQRSEKGTGGIQKNGRGEETEVICREYIDRYLR